MAKGKWICLVCLGAVFFIGQSALPGNGFKNDLKNTIIKNYNLDPNKVEIEIRRNSVDVDNIDYDSLSLKPLTRSEPCGLLSFQFSLFKQNQIIITEQIRLKIAHYEEVLITVNKIKRYDQITPDKYKIKRMEITSLTDKPLTSDEELAGMRAKRSIKRGQILISSIIEKIPTIVTGQGVSILYKSGGLQVTARGVAMETGYCGDQVRVKNEQSRKIIFGTILNSETVYVSTN